MRVKIICVLLKGLLLMSAYNVVREELKINVYGMYRFK